MNLSPNASPAKANPDSRRGDLADPVRNLLADKGTRADRTRFGDRLPISRTVRHLVYRRDHWTCQPLLRPGTRRTTRQRMTTDLSTPTPPDNPSSARSWRLDLPFPTPPLRDNDRGHWAVKARVTRELREQAGWLAHHYRLPRGLPFVAVTLCWQPAVHRRRDPLSITPTLKPLVDGLVDYGLVPDDDIGHVRLGCDIRPSVPRGPSRCWLDITEAS